MILAAGLADGRQQQLTTGDPNKDRALGVFFSEYTTEQEKKTKLDLLLAAIGGSGVLRLAGGVRKFTNLSADAVRLAVRYTYLPFTFWYRKPVIALAALDAITYIPFQVIEAQIMQWIMGGPANMPPIDGFKIFRDKDGAVTVVMPELWLTDP